MKKEDLKEMFIIMSLARTLDDRLLMIDDTKLRHMNKVVFKKILLESKKIYATLDNTLGMNVDTIDDMCDVLHNAINEIKNKIDLK